MSFDQLIAEIEKLTASERAGLVDRLIEDLGQNIDPAVERSHLDEIAKRRQDSSPLIPAGKVAQDIQRILGE